MLKEKALFTEANFPLAHGCSKIGCNLQAHEGLNECLLHANPKPPHGDEREYSRVLSIAVNSPSGTLDDVYIPCPVRIPVPQRNLSFQRAKFCGTVKMDGGEFHHHVSFSGAAFQRGLDLRGVRFLGGVTFATSIGPNGRCIPTRFEAGAVAEDGSLSCILTDSGTQFGARSSFAGSAFTGGTASFTGARFDGSSPDFTGARFDVEKLDFSEGVFREPPVFTDVAFPRGELIFDGRRFDINEFVFDFGELECDTLSFTGCLFNSSTSVSFSAKKIKCRRITFSHARFVASQVVRFQLGDVLATEEFSLSGVFHEGGAQFLFLRTSVTSPLVNLEGARFAGDLFVLQECVFKGSQLSFDRAEFAGSLTQISMATFESDLSMFCGITFGAQKTTLIAVHLIGRSVLFKKTQFAGDVEFTVNEVAAQVQFEDVKLDSKSHFSFIRPRFSVGELTSPSIQFDHVRFNPQITYFEGFGYFPNYPTDMQPPLVAFRYCYLREVYFLENEMTFFSFYRSAYFEESIFAASAWRSSREGIFYKSAWPRFDRQHVICEDLRGIKPCLETQADAPSGFPFPPSFPVTYREIADIYLRLKSAADRAKDYQLASWFYFNEFEMKRRHRWEAGGIPNRFSWLLYSLYRWFAGYGEKPAWSLTWFSVFALVFAGFHLNNGFRLVDTLAEGQPAAVKIAYDFSPTLDGLATFGTAQFWCDFGRAFQFSLNRVIPSNYGLGLTMKPEHLDSGILSILLSLSNSVVLIFMLIFIGIGLKRHFRRF